jgi:hypothetical protein
MLTAMSEAAARISRLAPLDRGAKPPALRSTAVGSGDSGWLQGGLIRKEYLGTAAGLRGLGVLPEGNY